MAPTWTCSLREGPMSAAEISKTNPPGGPSVVRVDGAVDSGFPADAFAGCGDAVVIDLDGVHKVTSSGVRDWRAAIEALHASYVAFIHVRPAVVSQFNMISGFGGNGYLVSLYLPYVCDECGSELERLVDVRKEFGTLAVGEVPEVFCPNCSTPMEFDDLPDSYLAYVQSQPVPKPIPTAEARPFRAQKDIVPDLTALWLSGTLTSGTRFRRLADGLDGDVMLLCGGLDAEGAQAVKGFSRLLQAPDARVSLARVPTALLSQMCEVIHGEVTGRVVSVVTTLTCSSCGYNQPTEIGAERIRDALKGTGLKCPRCKGAAVAEDLPEAAISCLYDGPVPPALETYLQQRPGNSPPADSQEAPPPPSKYEILQLIGRGGMAVVSMARQRGPEGFVKRVALKQILNIHVNNEQFSEMFLEEARLAAFVNHPNVVQIFDLGRDGDSFYIAMEFVDGWDLSDLISGTTEKQQQIPVRMACKIMQDVCAGLHAAHVATDDSGEELKIVHQDVSPHNVLISESGDVKLTDFGVARANTALSREMTDRGLVRGKILYMAPEQINTELGPVDARTDVYAAGVCLYEMLTGLNPFRRANPQAAVRAVLSGTRPPVERLRTDVPKSICDIIAKAMSQSPDDRFQSAREMGLAISGALLELGEAVTSAHLEEWLSEMAFERSWDVQYHTPSTGNPVKDLSPEHSPTEHDLNVVDSQAATRIEVNPGAALFKARKGDAED